MRDQLGRNISYLRLGVTAACNLRCRYCMPERGPSPLSAGDRITTEEILEVSRAAIDLGLTKIRLTGGEPLLRDDIVEIVSRLRQLPGLDELCMTTNGLLLEQYAVPLKRAGLGRLNISLDTLHPDRYREITRGGDLRRVLRGIDLALDLAFTPLKLNVVLLRGESEGDIPAFIRLTEKRAIHVRFIALMPIGESADWTSDRFGSENMVLDACPALVPETNKRDGVAHMYRLAGGVGSVGLIQPFSPHFCAHCNRIRVTADLRLKPCLHAAGEIPLRGLRGAALRTAMEAGILQKPACHQMGAGKPGCTQRNMYQIGG